MKEIKVVRTGAVGLAALLLLFPVTGLAATYTVFSTADEGPRTLRWAIEQANTNSGPDTIDFSIGSGPNTISPQSPLPPIADMTGGVLIDGYSEPGAQPNTQPQGSPTDAVLMIELESSMFNWAYGIYMSSNANSLQGLVINRFCTGVVIDGTQGGGMSNEVSGCYIGTDVSGSFAYPGSTFTGVALQSGASGNWVGGPDLEDRNLISGWCSEQVHIVGLNSNDNIVEGNYIGTEKDGVSAIGNLWAGGNGVSIHGDYFGSPMYNVVADNVISGNTGNGIEIAGLGQGLHSILSNYIGLDAAGSAPLGNGQHGVCILDYSQSSTIGPDNIIAFNDGDGICLIYDLTDFNAITHNSIYQNGGLGIDLDDDGVTANDPGDPDTGPNENLNFPLIDEAIYDSVSGQTLITGTLDIDTDPAQATIEVFQADPDPTGYGEGRVYLGSANPNVSGEWSTVVTGVAVGDWVTATTTDLNANTSEFSYNVDVVPPMGVAEKAHFAFQVPNIKVECCPNPFSRQTIISFSIPHSKANFDLGVYDLAGRVVDVLTEGESVPGTYCLQWDGRGLPSGVYFISLKTEGCETIEKLVLLR